MSASSDPFQTALQQARDDLRRAFLGYRDIVPSRGGLVTIDIALARLASAFHHAVPVVEEEPGLIGYVDCQQGRVRWIGQIQRFAEPVEEAIVVPGKRDG